MERGEIDLAVGLLPELDFGFYQRRLFSQGYVCLYRRDHPLAGRAMTLEEFAAVDHVSVVAEGTGHTAIETTLAQSGVRRNVKMRVPNFIAVANILKVSDMVAVAPEVFAKQAFELTGLASSPCPVPLPEITINMLWHAQNHRDPGNQWLRHHVFEMMAR